MQVTLDRRTCKRLQCTCEACFGGHLRNCDFESADCAVSVRLNQRPETTFKIYDRNGSIKTLVVTEENLKLAQASWTLLWEQQAGPII